MRATGELAGRLTERVSIARRETGRDAIGGGSGEWAVIGEGWAATEPMGTGPLVAGDAIRSRPRWRVTLRSGFDVAPDDRIDWRGRGLRVRACIADPRRADRIIIETEEEP
ncbi:head-tail adaptor [Sphingomonas laterariae]|uniref:Head-tail adaptor n=1 Tax=Edaphosphingomonas laterariae TaxID=861865 RepID=A0A239C9P3_9SPHN|nr:head-tail adaptor protein [Sphingomonas laterariae]SNS16612.1 head-tail adaptor [Sphingomonas laterariae]